MATTRVNLTPEFAIRSSCAGGKSRLNPELHEQNRRSSSIQTSTGQETQGPIFDLTKLWRRLKELRNLLVILGFDLRGRLRQLSRNLRLPELTRKNGAAPLSIRRVGRVWFDE
jgi:hypothetical protein